MLKQVSDKYIDKHGIVIPYKIVPVPKIKLINGYEKSFSIGYCHHMQQNTFFN